MWFAGQSIDLLKLRRKRMNLRTATTLAVVGAAISTVCQFLSVVARFVQPFARILYGGAGVFMNILFMFVSASYLIFFIILRSKQQ
jgi:hypothetical protein